MTKVYFVCHTQPEYDWKECSYAICKKIEKR